MANERVTQIAVESLQVSEPGNARVTQAAIEVLQVSTPNPDRVTQVAVEVVYTEDPNAQVTQHVIEAAYLADPSAQVSRHAIEVAYNNANVTAVRVSQISRRVLVSERAPNVRVTQVSRRALVTGREPNVRVTQISRRVLVGTGGDEEPPTPGTVTATPVAWDTVTVNVEAGSDNVGVVSRTIRVYSDEAMTVQVGADIPAIVGDNDVTGLSELTRYWFAVEFADAEGNKAYGYADATTLAQPQAQVSQHAVEVAYPTPPSVAYVDQHYAEIANEEPSVVEVHGLEVHGLDGGNAALDVAEVHELWAEIAKDDGSSAQVVLLAAEIACRTAEPAPSELPSLKRLDLVEGTWDGQRRKWEVRLFRKDANGDWKRLKTPSSHPVNAQFTLLASGGMADAHITWPVPFTAEQFLLDGDRGEVWVKRSSQWERWYRGTYRNGEGASGRPGSFSADFFGPMELCNYVDVNRRYAMPGQDVATLFSRLIDDFLDPRRIEIGLPPIQRRLTVIGEEVGTRDFSGTLLDAFNSLAQGVPGISWGIDLTPAGEDEFYLFRQDRTELSYTFALGMDAQEATIGYDSKDLVNSLAITGAANEDPNLIVNGGFEKPTGESQNILQNPSFEDGDGGYASHWEQTTGEPSRKQSAQDNVNAHSGSWFMELDNMQGIEKVTSDFTVLSGTAGETEMYGFRFWYAAENGDFPIDIVATLHFFDDAEVEQITENLTWTLTASSQRWQEFYRSFALSGERKFRVSFQTPSGGGSDKGAAIDEVSLYSLKSIRQENWDLLLNGAPDVLPTWDATPAPQDYYYVSLDVDTTGVDQSVKLRPDQSFSLREHQQVELSVMLRFWAREGGPASMDVQIGIERWDGTNWQVASGGSDPGIDTVTLTELDPGAWATYSVTAVGVDKTQEARPFVVVPQGQDGVLGVDALMVLRGSGDTTFQEGEANFFFRITTSDPVFQADVNLTVEQKALLASMISTYGTRERRLNVPEIRTRAQAVRYALNFFLQHAEARTPGPITLFDRLRLVKPDGLVRLCNVPDRSGLKPLFPVSVTHRFDRSGWHCEMERDIERPNDPRLWKEIKSEIIGVGRVARAGVEQTLASQQRG